MFTALFMGLELSVALSLWAFVSLWTSETLKALTSPDTHASVPATSQGRSRTGTSTTRRATSTGTQTSGPTLSTTTRPSGPHTPPLDSLSDGDTVTESGGASATTNAAETSGAMLSRPGSDFGMEPREPEHAQDQTRVHGHNSDYGPRPEELVPGSNAEPSTVRDTLALRQEHLNRRDRGGARSSAVEPHVHHALQRPRPRPRAYSLGRVTEATEESTPVASLADTDSESTASSTLSGTESA